MKRYYKILTPSVISVALLAGCASTPEENAELKEVNRYYERVQQSYSLSEQAPLEFEIARENVEKLNEMVDDGKNKTKIDQQIYITKRKIDIAKVAAEEKIAKSKISSAESRRKDIIIAAKTNEAQKAKSAAAVLASQAIEAESELSAMQARTRQLENEVQELSTKVTERGLVLSLSNILFELNEAKLKSGSERSISRVAEFLQEYPGHNILIEGFTDSSGEESYNQTLSENRAKAVKDSLVEMGISPSQINTRGYGESYPVASNETQSGRQQNRRVEIVIAKDAQTGVSER